MWGVVTGLRVGGATWGVVTGLRVGWGHVGCSYRTEGGVRPWGVLTD